MMTLRFLSAVVVCAAVLAPAACVDTSNTDAALQLAAVDLTATPNQLDFGDVYLGQAKRLAIRVENTGDVAVRLDAAQWQLPTAVATATEPSVVPPSSAATVSFTLHPSLQSDPGVVVGDVVLRVDGNVALSLSLTATLLAHPVCPRAPCRVATFDVVAGECVEAFVEGACDDGSACSLNDQCHDGVCVGDMVACQEGAACSVAVCDVDEGCLLVADHDACDDNNPCTTDRCDVDAGCVHEAIAEGGLCDDGNSCTGPGICRLGTCVAYAFEDGTACTSAERCVVDEVCQQGACVGTLLSSDFAVVRQSARYTTASSETAAVLADGSVVLLQTEESSRLALFSTSTGSLDLVDEVLFDDDAPWRLAAGDDWVFVSGGSGRLYVVDDGQLRQAAAPDCTFGRGFGGQLACPPEASRIDVFDVRSPTEPLWSAVPPEWNDCRSYGFDFDFAEGRVAVRTHCGDDDVATLTVLERERSVGRVRASRQVGADDVLLGIAGNHVVTRFSVRTLDLNAVDTLGANGVVQNMLREHRLEHGDCLVERPFEGLAWCNPEALRAVAGRLEPPVVVTRSSDGAPRVWLGQEPLTHPAFNKQGRPYVSDDTLWELSAHGAFALDDDLLPPYVDEDSDWQRPLYFFGEQRFALGTTRSWGAAHALMPVNAEAEEAWASGDEPWWNVLDNILLTDDSQLFALRLADVSYLDEGRGEAELLRLTQAGQPQSTSVALPRLFATEHAGAVKAWAASTAGLVVELETVGPFFVPGTTQTTHLVWAPVVNDFWSAAVSVEVDAPPTGLAVDGHNVWRGHTAELVRSTAQGGRWVDVARHATEVPQRPLASTDHLLLTATDSSLDLFDWRGDALAPVGSLAVGGATDVVLVGKGHAALVMGGGLTTEITLPCP